MEVALTPLEFARRARALYGDREAVVDGALRFTYEQFFERCDRFSAALQRLGVKPGDRVAYIAPNTHAQLESFYAVPQIGAVLVPINYRLSPDEFAYIITHSGATRRLRARGLPRVPRRRSGRSCPACGTSSRSRAPAPAVSTTRRWSNEASPDFGKPAIGERDLLTINYTSGTTSRPKGVMITHRNAYMNVVGTLLHLPMRLTDRYLWTLPMFHANGWTFTWTVTAVGAAHVCLRKVEPAKMFELIRDRRRVDAVRGADGADRPRQRAAGGARRRAEGRARRHRGRAAGGGDDRAGRRASSAGRSRTSTASPRPRRSSPSASRDPSTTRCRPRERAVIKARQGVELITSGELRVVDEDDRDVPHDGATVGEIIVRGNVVMEGYYNDPEASATALRGGCFHTGDAAVVHPDGYVEIRDRLKDVIISGGENISSVEVEGVLLRHPAVQEVAVVGMPDAKWGEAPHAFVVLKPARSAIAGRAARVHPRAPGALQVPAHASTSSPSCRRPRRGRFRSSCCAGRSRRSRHSRRRRRNRRARKDRREQRSRRSQSISAVSAVPSDREDSHIDRAFAEALGGAAARHEDVEVAPFDPRSGVEHRVHTSVRLAGCQHSQARAERQAAKIRGDDATLGAHAGPGWSAVAVGGGQHAHGRRLPMSGRTRPRLGQGSNVHDQHGDGDGHSAHTKRPSSRVPEYLILIARRGRQ